jgi:hypothetical protein
MSPIQQALISTARHDPSPGIIPLRSTVRLCANYINEVGFYAKVISGTDKLFYSQSQRNQIYSLAVLHCSSESCFAIAFRPEIFRARSIRTYIVSHTREVSQERFTCQRPHIFS